MLRAAEYQPGIVKNNNNTGGEGEERRDDCERARERKRERERERETERETETERERGRGQSSIQPPTRNTNVLTGTAKATQTAPDIPEPLRPFTQTTEFNQSKQRSFCRHCLISTSSVKVKIHSLF